MSFGLVLSIAVGIVWIIWFTKKYNEKKQKMYILTLIYPIIYITANLPYIRSNPIITRVIILAAIFGAVPLVYLFMREQLPDTKR